MRVFTLCWQAIFCTAGYIELFPTNYLLRSAEAHLLPSALRDVDARFSLKLDQTPSDDSLHLPFMGTSAGANLKCSSRPYAWRCLGPFTCNPFRCLYTRQDGALARPCIYPSEAPPDARKQQRTYPRRTLREGHREVRPLRRPGPHRPPVEPRAGHGDQEVRRARVRSPLYNGVRLSSIPRARTQLPAHAWMRGRTARTTTAGSRRRAATGRSSYGT